MPFKFKSILLPEDVVLYIQEFFDLHEIIALSQTCKSYYILSQQHSTLWIGPLTRARALTPLFCSPHEDLTLLDGKRLRNIAIQTLRRDRNWSLPTPSPVDAVTSISLAEFNLNVILPIPGTGLFLLYSKADGHLICWDVKTKRAVCPPLDIGGVGIAEISAGEMDRSQYSIALLLEPPVRNANISFTLIVVEVSFGQQIGGVRLQTTFKHVFEKDDFFRLALFMHGSIVGLLQRHFRTQRVDIIAFNRSSHKMVHLDTQNQVHIGMFEFTRTTVHDNGDLYILSDSPDATTWSRCGWFHLPYDQNPDCATESTVEMQLRLWRPILWKLPAEELEAPNFSGHHYPQGPPSLNPPYDVLVISLHDDKYLLRNSESVCHNLNAVFWTGSTTVPNGKITLPGTLKRHKRSDYPWPLVHLAYSGLTILFMMDGPPTLQMIRYNTQERTSSIHQLNVPPVVDLDRVQALLVDDHVGTVALLDKEFVLHVISFA